MEARSGVVVMEGRIRVRVGADGRDVEGEREVGGDESLGEGHQLLRARELLLPTCEPVSLLLFPHPTLLTIFLSLSLSKILLPFLAALVIQTGLTDIG